jgi:hypothetical protein
MKMKKEWESVGGEEREKTKDKGGMAEEGDGV